MKDIVEFYKEDNGDWRWKRTSGANGERVGASSEGYKNLSECKDNFNRSLDLNFDIKEPESA